MLKLKDEVRGLVSVFLAYRNDIDIYTEDNEKDKEFYKALFGRLIRSDIRINDITPLGCKKNVIEKCKTDTTSERKKIYIIDGDLTMLTGKKIKHKNLFTLDRYCIENFLIDETSVCNFIYGKCGIKSKKDIEDEIKFNTWLAYYSESLIQLFIHFAIMDSFGGKFRLYNAYKYHQADLFDNNSVLDDIEELKKNIISTYGAKDYLLKYNEFSSRWGNNIETFLSIISGKDYLIPILIYKTRQFSKSTEKPSLEEIKINLVQHFDISRMNRLKDAIESM